MKKKRSPVKATYEAATPAPDPTPPPATMPPAPPKLTDQVDAIFARLIRAHAGQDFIAQSIQLVKILVDGYLAQFPSGNAQLSSESYWTPEEAAARVVDTRPVAGLFAALESTHPDWARTHALVQAFIDGWISKATSAA